jgi:hypothetical protein
MVLGSAMVVVNVAGPHDTLIVEGILASNTSFEFRMWLSVFETRIVSLSFLARTV